MLFLLVFGEHRTALSFPRLFLSSFLHVAKVLCTRAQTEDKDALRAVCAFFLQCQNKNQADDGLTAKERKDCAEKLCAPLCVFFFLPPPRNQFCQVTRRNPESTLRYCSFNEVINTQAAVVGLTASLSLPDYQGKLLKEHLKTRVPAIETSHYARASGHVSRRKNPITLNTSITNLSGKTKRHAHESCIQSAAVLQRRFSKEACGGQSRRANGAFCDEGQSESRPWMSLIFLQNLELRHNQT